MMSANPTFAVVFPGQGCQRPGMGRDFFQASRAARDVYEEASTALGYDVAALCFEEDERLNQAEFTQPALLTTEIAMTRVLQTEFGFEPKYYGGHSLGEHTALCAAGVVSLASAVRAASVRGRMIQNAVPLGSGAMVAVCGPDAIDRVTPALAARFGVEIANRNAANQLVLSGKTEKIEEACVALAELLTPDGFELIRLKVSAPFHSSLLKVIEPELEQLFATEYAALVPSRAPFVTSNLRGGFHSSDRAQLLADITQQVCGTVDFISNMQTLMQVASKIYEVGPGKPLRGFFKSVGLEVNTVLSLRAAEREFKHAA